MPKARTVEEFLEGIPGVYRDVPFSDYQRLQAVTRGALQDIRRSPLHYITPGAEDPEEVSKKKRYFIIGSALDMMICDGEAAMRAHYKIAPEELDLRRKNDKEIWAALIKSVGFERVIKEKELRQVISMAQSLLAHPEVQKALSGNYVYQPSVVWHDPETGLLCKGRPDIVNLDSGLIMDIKSAHDASYDGFLKHYWELGYYLQAAQYTEGMAVATVGAFEPSGFIFAAAESSEPFPVAMYGVSEEDMGFGQWERSSLLKRLEYCTRNDSWPGYNQGVHTLRLPPWYRTKTEGTIIRGA